MKKIATLGPAGTFTELAAKKFISAVDDDLEIVFYSSFLKTFNALGKECDYAIIPIENTLDGYVERSLDLLLNTQHKICGEVFLPIKFAFVSNEKDLLKLKKIYVQFKTQGQCLKFLDGFENDKIIITETNGISFDEINKGRRNEAAVIPQHMFSKSMKYEYYLDNVTDYLKNETRFIVLSKNDEDFDESKSYKTSLIILDVADEPGALADILNKLAQNKINLHSIMSRPTKKVLGKYHFFIDIEGHYPENKIVKNVIDEIVEKNNIKIVGAYSAIN
jgi:prephenate dehydratase